MLTLGDRLREARQAAHRTHTEVAQAIRVSRYTVHNWEKGHSEPRVSQLLAIAEYLATTPEFLLGLAVA